MARLIRKQDSEKKIYLDQILSDMEKKHQLERNNELTKHQNELQLLVNGLSQDGLELKKVELLENQRMEIDEMNGKFAKDIHLMEASSKAELESKHTKEKLELREKHYQVIPKSMCENASISY